MRKPLYHIIFQYFIILRRIKVLNKKENLKNLFL